MRGNLIQNILLLLIATAIPTRKVSHSNNIGYVTAPNPQHVILIKIGQLVCCLDQSDNLETEGALLYQVM